MALPAFAVQFYKGDTYTLVVDLSDGNGVIPLTNSTVTLSINDNTLKASINNQHQAAIFIDKQLSSSLPAQKHKVWLVFETQQTKYTYMGFIKVLPIQ